jgi:hypothetical protein
MGARVSTQSDPCDSLGGRSRFRRGGCGDNRLDLDRMAEMVIAANPNPGKCWGWGQRKVSPTVGKQKVRQRGKFTFKRGSRGHVIAPILWGRHPSCRKPRATRRRRCAAAQRPSGRRNLILSSAGPFQFAGTLYPTARGKRIGRFGSFRIWVLIGLPDCPS